MPDEIAGHCWNCGRDLTRADYGREATCLDCDKATHCCLNCRHHAPGRPNACLEPLVERVLDKDRSNFCDLFEPAIRPGGATAKAEDPARLRQAAEDLFK